MRVRGQGRNITNKQIFDPGDRPVTHSPIYLTGLLYREMRWENHVLSSSEEGRDKNVKPEIQQGRTVADTNRFWCNKSCSSVDEGVRTKRKNKCQPLNLADTQ